jgi:hypothetical protein
MKIRPAAALVCAMTLAAVSAWAAETPSTATTTTASEQKAPEEKAGEKGPVRVEVGTYINQILAIDLKGN